MDVFWLVPFAIAVIVFVWIFTAMMKRRRQSPVVPHVLVDKPSEKPPVDDSVKARDWSSRPSGSYMEWLTQGRDKKPPK